MVLNPGTNPVPLSMTAWPTPPEMGARAWIGGRAREAEKNWSEEKLSIFYASDMRE